MKVSLEKIVKENDSGSIKSFWFLPDKPLDHIAGQFIEMTISSKSPDERGIKRWFTISSSPSKAPLFSITTKFSDPSSSFKLDLKTTKFGDSILISDPMGDFVLPMDGSIPLVFVAGGIGITPFHSIITWLIDNKISRDISFLYAAKDQSDLIFLKELEHYGLKTVILLDKPTGSWDGEKGQLSGQRIIDLVTPGNNSLIYISGPEKMVETLSTELHELGVEKTRIIGDFFPGYSSI